MKKIFTLIAATMMAVCANAQKFCWDNAEAADDYVATAGTIECLGGDKNDRLNYTNTALGVLYKTICLNGKSANLDDGSSNGTYMKVTFASPLAAGDVISITAYRNKDNSTSGASALLKFDNGAADVVVGGSDGMGFVNLNADGDTPDATAPNTLTYTVTAAEAGAASMNMTRSKASTNLFITKLVVSGGTAGISNVTTVSAAKVVKAIENGQLVIKAANGKFNVAGARVK